MHPIVSSNPCGSAPIPFKAAAVSSAAERSFYVQPLPCGFPSPAEEATEGRLDLNALMIQNVNATFFFRVQGNSMSGIGLVDGSYIVVDRSIVARSGHIVLAVVNGDYTVKRLVIDGNRIALHAEHPDYAPIEFADGDELSVWGTVTGWAYRLPA